MAPIIEVTDKTLQKLDPQSYILRTDLEKNQIAEIDRSGWIVMPYEFISEHNHFAGKSRMVVDPARLAYSPAVEKAGRELGVSYENSSRDSLGREFVGNNNWYNFLKLNSSLRNKTPTLREFREILNFFNQGMNGRINVYDINGKKIRRDVLRDYFEDIAGVKSPWRAEWVDDYFEEREDGLYLLTQNKSNAEKLDKDTLMEDKTPGISLADLINKNYTKQGLPKKDVEKGSLYSWYPRSDCVAGFVASPVRAGLDCDRVPSYSLADLGVRGIKHE